MERSNVYESLKLSENEKLHILSQEAPGGLAPQKWVQDLKKKEGLRVRSFNIGEKKGILWKKRDSRMTPVLPDCSQARLQ